MSDKVKNVVVTVVFFGMIIVLFFVNAIKKDSEISVAERRKLAGFPEFSFSKLFDGTFFNKFGGYVTDQFVNREGFRKLKVDTELNVFNKKDYSSLYEFDGFLVENLYPLNVRSVQNVVEKVNNIYEMFLGEDNDVYFSIIPDKNYFIDNGNLKLDYSELEELLEEKINGKYIPIMDSLELSDYYMTDSHWKQECLTDVANQLLSGMGKYSNFEYVEKKFADFKGTYAGRIPVETANDEIILLSNEVLDNAKVFYYDTNESNGIYDFSKVNSLDKYDVYLSGAVPLLTIENDMANSDDELIVFRDSYGSSIIPLLVPAYKKITVVDTRYISPMLLSENIEFSGRDVLFLYSTLLINNSFTLK